MSNSFLSRPTSLSLLRRAAANETDAWRSLVHLYGPLVHSWCARSGLREADAADVFQESFRAVFKNLPKFRPNRATGSFRAWLRTIVRSKITDHFRRQQLRPEAFGGTDARMRLANVADSGAELRLNARAEAVEEPAAGVDAPGDEAVVLRRALDLIREEFNERSWKGFWHVVVDGKSAADVARELGSTPEAVRQANYRIRRRLRALLDGLVH